MTRSGYNQESSPDFRSLLWSLHDRSSTRKTSEVFGSMENTHAESYTDQSCCHRCAGYGKGPVILARRAGNGTARTARCARREITGGFPAALRLGRGTGAAYPRGLRYFEVSCQARTGDASYLPRSG